jgi:hypothetical protein
MPTPGTRLSSSRTLRCTKLERNVSSNLLASAGFSAAMLRTWTMLVDCLRVVTPWRCTSWGRRGTTLDTRFCTSTWAMSTSVPSSNVTSSEYEPSLLLVEFM